MSWKSKLVRANDIILQYAEGASSKLVVTEPLPDLVGGTNGYTNFLNNYERSQPATVWDFMVKT